MALLACPGTDDLTRIYFGKAMAPGRQHWRARMFIKWDHRLPHPLGRRWIEGMLLADSRASE